MAYEIEFTTTVTPLVEKSYINACCWGGDVICDRLLSQASIWKMYGSAISGQEDWGWYIWIRQGRRMHRIHVQCDDIKSSVFRMQVYSSEKSWFKWKDVDFSDTDRINLAVAAEIRKWGIIQSVTKWTPDFKTEL